MCINNNGYAKVTRRWNDSDMIELNFSMPIEIMQANPKVRANIGKVAIMRGPVVITGEAGWDDAHIDLSAKSSNR